MWAAQFYQFQKADRWVTSGGLGTMGFGLPAAIGAQLADKDATVVSILGDGGFQMTLQEPVCYSRSEPSDQGRGLKQPLPRNGPAMAGNLLR